LLRRFTGAPVAEVIQVAADTQASHVLELVLAEGSGGPVDMTLPDSAYERATLSASAPAYRRNIRLNAQNAITVTLGGNEGWAATMRIREGAALIDATGGTVRAAGNSATLTFPAGAAEQPIVAGITTVPDRLSAGLAKSATYRVTVPLQRPGLRIDMSTEIDVRVPLRSPVVAGTTLLVSALHARNTEPMWAFPTSTTNGGAALSVSIAELRTHAQLHHTGNVDLSWQVEEFQSVLPGPASPRPSRPGDAGAVIAQAAASCQPLPATLVPPYFASCNQTTLSRVGSTSVDPTNATAIVLVHGWHTKVADWISYYNYQGLDCADPQQRCVIDPKRPRDLPGIAYFGIPFITRLQQDFPDSPIYVFDYESWRDYETETGVSLQHALAQAYSRDGFKDAIVVGHSMGGLVARSAAIGLGSQSVLVRGILTLGSPHLGTPLPNACVLGNPFACRFFPALFTPGGDRLNRPLDRKERTRLFAYAGNLFGNRKLAAPELRVSYLLLATLLHPNNDGVVPVASALPAWGDTLVTLHSPYFGYDHFQIKTGRSPLSTDPVYQQIVEDICELLSCGNDQVFVRAESSCALRATGELWCWGYNFGGYFGNGSTNSSSSPVRSGGGLRFTSIDMAVPNEGDHVCGIVQTHEAYCWGSNSEGQLGDGSQNRHLSPVLVRGPNQWLAIAGGGTHTCGIAAGGRGYCWGRNNEGQLGDGTLIDKLTPAPIHGNLVLTAIDVGEDHACALDMQGLAWCWGEGAEGQLGNGSVADRTTPTLVSSTLAFRSITTGDEHTCAITLAGRAYCWGGESEGKLGNGSSSNQVAPIAVATSLSFASISAGDEHTCGVSPGGIGFCWGEGEDGQLGTGNLNSVSTPAAVNTSIKFKFVAAGEEHSCGVTVSGQYWCWGLNRQGMVGPGIPVSQRTTTPIRVSVP
jgi:alpha-tubulin suppressor-like RCC1 family protein/pimeloyl-ACP methyl ester carboxylesterase